MAEELFTEGGDEDGLHTKLQREEDVPEVHLEVEEGDEVREAEDVDEEHPSFATIIMASALESPPPGACHTLTPSVAAETSFLSHHYA